MARALPVSDLKIPVLELGSVARLSYLHPSVVIAISDDLRVITATIGPDASTFRREVNYALYREKIYAETLAMREALVAAVTRK